MNPIKSDDGVRKDHEESVGDPTSSSSSSSVAGDHDTLFTAGEAATASMAKNEADLVVEDDTKNQNSCVVDSNKKRKREDDDKQEQHSSPSKKRRGSAKHAPLKDVPTRSLPAVLVLALSQIVPITPFRGANVVDMAHPSDNAVCKIVRIK